MRIDTFYNINDTSGQLPHLLIEQNEHGKAVKARHALAADEVIINIDGPSVTYAETLVRGKNESYYLQVGINAYIKPAFPFYLFNHSCNPNCGINESLQLVTTRNIKPREELCWDYSTSMLERHWTLDCSCGEGCCRKKITDFDLLPATLQKHYLDTGIVLPFIRKYLIDQQHRKI